jgi:hypothetical protein
MGETNFLATNRRKAATMITEALANEQPDDDLEKRLAERVRLENLKQPLPTFAPPPLTPEQIAAAQAERVRLENLKKPALLPPKPAPDFAQLERERMERERRHEWLKGALR